MAPANVFLIFTDRLEAAGIPYMATGSVPSNRFITNPNNWRGELRLDQPIDRPSAAPPRKAYQHTQTS